MRPEGSASAGSLLPRLAAFAALSVLAAVQWARLVEDPPAGSVALAVLAGLAGAAVLALISTGRPAGVVLRGRAAALLAVAAVVLATVVGLVAVGVPTRLFLPTGWGELASAIGDGISGLTGDVKYPYGRGGWTRVVILGGLPVAIGAAAALAFWPGRRDGPPRPARAAALAILVAAFATGATIVAPAAPLAWGFLLLVALVAWRALPSLSGRDAIAAGLLVAAAGVLALPLAAALDREDPVLNFRNWELGRSSPATFDWNHGYGPLDWPREGTAVAAIASKQRQYWKQAVLEEFDGERWVRSERSVGPRLELPTQVEGGSGPITLHQGHPGWVERMRVTIGPMETKFVLAAGSLVALDGIDGAYARPDGTTLAPETLADGDSYFAVAYVPQPKPTQLRDVPAAYPRALDRYTEITLPGRPEPADGEFVSPAPPTAVQVPLRGSRAPSRDRAARRAIAVSPYASTQRLARRLAAGESTAYGVARAIEDHLQGFTYTESPPQRDNPLPAFLFRDRQGYCQQFSGAMALLLRMNGIPARVAAGFSPGDPDPDDKDRFLVEDLDAHSWVEAYFPTIGWVTFDPTPSGAPATGRTSNTNVAGIAADVDPNEATENLRRGSIAARPPIPGGAEGAGGNGFPWWALGAAVAIVAIIAVGVVGGLTAARRLRYRGLSPEERADAHLRELPTALARLGWEPARTETLLALERRLGRARLAAAAAYVAKLRAERYSAAGAGTPTLAERGAMRDDLGRNEGWRARIRAWLAVPPGGPG